MSGICDDILLMCCFECCVLIVCDFGIPVRFCLVNCLCSVLFDSSWLLIPHGYLFCIGFEYLVVGMRVLCCIIFDMVVLICLTFRVGE